MQISPFFSAMHPCMRSTPINRTQRLLRVVAKTSISMVEARSYWMFLYACTGSATLLNNGLKQITGRNSLASPSCALCRKAQLINDCMRAGACTQ